MKEAIIFPERSVHKEARQDTKVQVEIRTNIRATPILT